MNDDQRTTRQQPVPDSALPTQHSALTNHSALLAGRRQAWLARLGRPVDLDYPFFAIGDVFPQGPSRTIATGELGTGRVAAGDVLEAVGYAPSPIRVRVARVERPDAQGRGVTEVSEGVAGDVLGLTLEHDASSEVVLGQCLAPSGRLRALSVVDADVWIVTPDDLPCIPEEQREILDAVAAGRGLDLYFHTREVPARARGEWRPALGEEYRVVFDLAVPVAVYEGARFGLRHRGLTIGAAFVIGMG
jgi:translation elongation factor EF-Tu-like GTPase